MPDTGTLKGLRREMTREMFEELAALQCEVPEILGYVGTTAEKLEKWCRKTYRHPLDEMLRMIRQDGLVAIISQQYNRFLPQAGAEDRSQADSAIRAFTAMMNPSGDTVRELFE